MWLWCQVSARGIALRTRVLACQRPDGRRRAAAGHRPMVGLPKLGGRRDLEAPEGSGGSEHIMQNIIR